MRALDILASGLPHASLVKSGLKPSDLFLNKDQEKLSIGDAGCRLTCLFALRLCRRPKCRAG